MNLVRYCMTCDSSKPTEWTPQPGTPCEKGEDLDPAAGYGMITSIHVDTGFLFAGNRQNDAAYLAEHEAAGMQREAAFYGRYQTNNAPIPPGSSTTVVSSYKGQNEEGGYVMVDQMSYVGSWGNWASPVVRVYLAENAVVGSAPIGHASGDLAQLMVYDIVGGSLCLAAVGVGGTLEISRAEGLKQVDGGSLAFSGSNVRIYHPTATPYLPSNITSSLGGTPVCATR
jgi:hypothetical protein